MDSAVWGAVVVVVALIAWDAWRRWLAREASDLRGKMQALTDTIAGVSIDVAGLHTEMADIKRIAGNASMAALGQAGGGVGRKVLRR